MNRVTAIFGLLAAALLAAGCAVPQWQKPGTPEAEVVRALGPPTLTVPLEDGGQRLLYSRQPEVYHMDFDAQRRLSRVTQALTLEQFQALRGGQDTRESVRQRFGPPARVEHVASFDGDIWMYHFLDASLARRAHVHIDPEGVVRFVMFTDEPVFERFGPR